MKKDFKLEVKKKQDNNSIFYKYRYETCIFWFSQDQINGNIYSVSILDTEYHDVVYYSHDTKDRFYPTDIEVIFPKSVVKNDNDYIKLNNKVQHCCLRRHAIEDFLLSGEHYKLWLEKHGEN